MKMYFTYAFLVFLLPLAASADCLLPVGKATMAVKEINGAEVYVVSKEYIDQLQCLDIDLLTEQDQRIKQLEALLTNYRNTADNLETNLLGYKDVNQQLNTTLENSTALTSSYDTLLIKYERLSNDFSSLLDRYDELTDKYRNIALKSHSTFNFDAGIGLDTDGEMMGLLGVGVKNMRAWGISQKDNNGLIIGVSLPF